MQMRAAIGAPTNRRKPKATTMQTATQLYEDALTILDALSIAEDDFLIASRLNACIVELAILKCQSTTKTDETKEALRWIRNTQRLGGPNCGD
jgi:hypothetical protein